MGATGLAKDGERGPKRRERGLESGEGGSRRRFRGPPEPLGSLKTECGARCDSRRGRPRFDAVPVGRLEEGDSGERAVWHRVCLAWALPGNDSVAGRSTMTGWR